MQQGPHPHGDPTDEDGLAPQVAEDTDKGGAPAVLQTVLDHQQHIGARGQGRQQIGQRKQHPGIGVHEQILGVKAGMMPASLTSRSAAPLPAPKRIQGRAIRCSMVCGWKCNRQGYV